MSSKVLKIILLHITYLVILEVCKHFCLVKIYTCRNIKNRNIIKNIYANLNDGKGNLMVFVEPFFKDSC